MGRGKLVDPRDGYPLGLRRQAVNGLQDLVEGVAKVVVDDNQVEVLVVGALQLSTVLHGAFEVVLLLKGRRRMFMNVSCPAALLFTHTHTHTHTHGPLA